MESEIKTLETAMTKACGSAVEELKQLPLIKEETDEGKKGTTSTTPTPEQTHPGVIKGITIKGDIGGTSTTTGTTDISTQIIEKEETATKLREEATRAKEVAVSQTEELEEIITTEKKVLEETEKSITTSKTTLTNLRAKEKEINIKITTSTETTEIESYKKELVTISTQISTTKSTIKTHTHKKTNIKNKINESVVKQQEIQTIVETTESDA